MTDKLIAHHEAKHSLYSLEMTADLDVFDKNQKIVEAYINQQEQFAKDVARYFELKQGIPPLEDEMNYQFTQQYRLEDESKDDCYFRISCEYIALEDKLSKVGKEE